MIGTVPFKDKLICFSHILSEIGFLVYTTVLFSFLSPVMPSASRLKLGSAVIWGLIGLIGVVWIIFVSHIIKLFYMKRQMKITQTKKEAEEKEIQEQLEIQNEKKERLKKKQKLRERLQTIQEKEEEIVIYMRI